MRGTGELLRGLNVAQREAVSTTEGPVLVLAGAGTGKTRVITYRIAYLLARGVRPESVLGLTFTNKAAAEMRERIGHLLGGGAKGIVLSTFHSLGMRILRTHAQRLGYRRNFSIHDTSDQVSLVRTIARDIRGDVPAKQPAAILAAISRLKNRLVFPDAAADEADDDFEALVATVYARYQEHLRVLNSVDFDDLILLPAALLEREPEVRDEYRHRFRYILVDEYQDTNGAQYELLQRLVNPARNLCVVGDDDQSIYGFRGADREKILRFERDFPGATVVKLEENYRSTERILRLANAVIAAGANRHDKELRSTLGRGERVRLVFAEDEAAEVDTVVREIDLLRSDPATRERPVAILVRSAQQARPFEQKLRLRQIPYVLIGGQSWFDRKEIRDVLAYWKATANPSDDLSLLRVINVPKRGFGTGTIEKLDAFARTERISISEALPRIGAGEGDFAPRVRASCTEVAELFSRARDRLERREFSDMASSLIAEADYAQAVTDLYPDPLVRDARWRSVREFVNSVGEWARRDPTAEFTEFLSALSLDEQLSRGKDEDATRGGRVTLMTLHSAKGLEFPVVYLVGVEEDILPHRRSVADGDHAIEEERRIFYVGITRAREELVMTCASSRNLYGESKEREPSRFLTELANDADDLFSREEACPEDASPADVADVKDLYRRMIER